VIIDREPTIRVGLITAAPEVKFVLDGGFVSSGQSVPDGEHSARLLDGAASTDWSTANEIVVSPRDLEQSRFTVHGVKIGINFHWEREESQRFEGVLKIVASEAGLTIINELPLESYLVSVISSEMSASCPMELLKAHAVVSRSWLLAQLSQDAGVASEIRAKKPANGNGELIRWYDRENHSGFDVCADDHCQRYQGISKAFSQAAFEAVRDTRGKTLIFENKICDTRYSKSCGGMTEVYRAAWEDKDVPYLPSIYDAPTQEPEGYVMPLSIEKNAVAWIDSSPDSYCGAVTPDLLRRIVPAFDQETPDFYRWRVEYGQSELREILKTRLGIDFGLIRSMEAIERGESGRIIRLNIVGANKTLVIGKELEIRRALSRSHLYSSAFVVHASDEQESGCPKSFVLSGAGWGHGVGLCQIGAAVMADRGANHLQILSHYFKGAETADLY